MHLILSTRNQSKARQISALFSDLPVTLLSLDEAAISGEAIEDGTTLEENALKKAVFAWERSKAWSLADDSGIFIDALNGSPGVYSARWAGEGATTEDIMHFTLSKLSGVSEEKRTAVFKTVAAVISPDGSQTFFSGETHGRILLEPRTPCRPKMPYSAIFLPEGENKVLTEMTLEEENLMSHRGKAFLQVRQFFEDILKKNG